MDISKAIKRLFKTTWQAPERGGFYVKPELYFLRSQKASAGSTSALEDVSVTQYLTPLYIEPGCELVIRCDEDGRVEVEVRSTTAEWRNPDADA